MKKPDPRLKRAGVSGYNKEIQMKPEHKKKVNKVIKGLKKASKSHAAQAKTLQKVFRKGKTKK